MAYALLCAFHTLKSRRMEWFVCAVLFIANHSFIRPLSVSKRRESVGCGANEHLEQPVGRLGIYTDTRLRATRAVAMQTASCNYSRASRGTVRWPAGLRGVNAIECVLDDEYLCTYQGRSELLHNLLQHTQCNPCAFQAMG